MTKRSESVIVNGYKVPGGWGGVAVRRACETVAKDPGIRQSDLHTVVTDFTRLNRSNSTWIVTPGAKSPAGILWERAQVSSSGSKAVFRCTPNEFTGTVGGSAEAALDLYREFFLKYDVQYKLGDLARPREDLAKNSPWKTGIVVGFQLGRKSDAKRVSEIAQLTGEDFEQYIVETSHYHRAGICYVVSSGSSIYYEDPSTMGNVRR